MKTVKNHLLVLTLLISAVSSMKGQSFSIKGLFCNKNEKAISACYTLKTGNTVVSSGSGKKINIQLQLNQNYALTVTKQGHQSKTVYFSTHTRMEKNFRFHFQILLSKLDNTLVAGNMVAGEVFYDLETKNFNYKAY